MKSNRESPNIVKIPETPSQALQRGLENLDKEPHTPKDEFQWIDRTIMSAAHKIIGSRTISGNPINDIIIPKFLHQLIKTVKDNELLLQSFERRQKALQKCINENNSEPKLIEYFKNNHKALCLIKIINISNEYKEKNWVDNNKVKILSKWINNLIKDSPDFLVMKESIKEFIKENRDAIDPPNLIFMFFNSNMRVAVNKIEEVIKKHEILSTRIDKEKEEKTPTESKFYYSGIGSRY